MAPCFNFMALPPPWAANVIWALATPEESLGIARTAVSGFLMTKLPGTPRGRLFWWRSALLQESCGPDFVKLVSIHGVRSRFACHSECHMGLRPTNGDENRLESMLYDQAGVER